ncbi:ECF transporter S component [Lachnoclostridium sp. An181]|uniref:ECF transporter S component n=1 Tax=Lachnoclostridium sp. An181 TaxID=1965575 RepID=UPI000B3A48AF|nr:ECF transporter S component [Lachnoclostridium sp. An181]OUP49445.1 ECF transporter S component [Lachnoclostridium sp. An181]
MSTKTISQKNGNTRTKTIAQISMLSAAAVILMLFEFPLPFIAPTFYELDFSEIPVLIGAFAMGPLAGVVVEGVKILLNLAINGTITAGVGELANFIMGCAFVVPAGLIYRNRKTRKHAILGLCAGTVTMTVVACIINAYVLLPAYGAAFSMPVDAFIEMGSAINGNIHSLLGFVMIAVAPFNLIKAVIDSAVVVLIYKKISPVFKMSR